MQLNHSDKMDMDVAVVVAATCVMAFEMLNNLPVGGNGTRTATEHIQNLVNLCHFNPTAMQQLFSSGRNSEEGLLKMALKQSTSSSVF